MKQNYAKKYIKKTNSYRIKHKSNSDTNSCHIVISITAAHVFWYVKINTYTKHRVFDAAAIDYGMHYIK